MNSVKHAAAWALVLIAAGCAKTTVTNRESYSGSALARPDRIIVYDFAATPADLPPGSQMQLAAPDTPPAAEEIDVGRKLGAQVAEDLVKNIQKMGLPAVRSAGQPPARDGDLVLMGYFASIDQGSAIKRMTLGFGSGSAELKTVVEGYLMTDKGLRRLGSGQVDSSGGKMPGVAAPAVVAVATGNPIGLIVGGALKVGGEVTGRSTIEGSAERTAKEISDQLRVAFQRQGWI